MSNALFARALELKMMARIAHFATGKALLKDRRKKMEIDWKNHAKNLKEIGNRMADELSVMAHTKGITVRANAALKDWDPAVVSFYQDMHKNGDKLI